jgi:polyhydroxyalkanoate synthesis regulator phasin
MQEALRTYFELAMGLTEASRKTVRKVVKDAVGKSNATADQAKALTTDLLAMNSANREALAKLVRFEVDRALGLVGLATAEEVNDLTVRVRQLERALRDVSPEAGAQRPAAARKAPAGKNAAARKTAPETGAAAEPTPAPKTSAKKAVAAKAAPATTVAAKAAPVKAVAKKTVAKKAGAKKAGATKTTAAAAKRTPA